MEADLIFLQGITIMIATQSRIMTRNNISSLGPRLFLLEMLATFQLCSCFNILRPLTELDPKFYLGQIYSFSVLHFYLTLNENTSNPASVLVYVLRKGMSMKLGTLKITAQFIGAFFAMFYQNVLWSIRTNSLLSNPRICSHPLHTDLLKAFCTELITSFMFQLAVLKSQSQELRVRANVLAIAISSLVYAGGHLTGAIFNPALAFSMHISCFSEKFWNYILVYWIAPCIGSVLVVIAWDEILPLIQRGA